MKIFGMDSDKVLSRIVLFFLLCLVFCVGFNYFHKENIECVVVQKTLVQQKISHYGEGLDTEYQYLILTDKGTFEVSPSGLFAAPEYMGKIKDGDTINIVTRGFGFELMGVYRNIVEVNQYPSTK